jgi:hypothetical protein
MTTFKPYQQLDWLTTESPLMSSAEDSLAKTSASQEREQDLQASAADCGGIFTGLSKKSARRGSSLKTYQPFAVTDWEMSCGPSLRSGTMRSGTVYPLPPLALLTDGTESGLWPTPRSCTAMAATITPESAWSSKRFRNLETMVGRRMWPTPTAVWRPMEGNVRLLREKVLAGEMTEEEATQMLGKSPYASQGKLKAMWPTPAARDYRGANGYETTMEKLKQGKRPHLDQLPNAVQAAENKPIRGTLNPTWVEWLMGFPLGWTDSKPSATP